jgi:zinc protease
MLLVLLALPGWAQAPDRSQPPRPGPPPALRLPEVVRRQISNGVPVWIAPRSRVPMASVVLLLRAGADQDPPGKYGLAVLTADMLDEGAGGRDALQFAEAVEHLGAVLKTDTDYDATWVTLEVPSARLSPALDLMADMVLRPTFPAGELARLQREGLVAFRQWRDDPAALAAAALAATLYGPNHRYGVAVAGTAAQFVGLTRQDVQSFYAARYRPGAAAFVVCGDVAPEGVVEGLEARFGGWQPGAVPLLPAPAPPSAPGAGIFLVDVPGAQQSALQIGQVGVARTTEDYFPLQVANTVLGGSFTSRLNQSLREEHGYTYGAGSRFSMRLGCGPFAVRTAVQADATGAAVGEILRQLRAILQPIPSAELEKARAYVAYRFPGEFETSSELARRLAEQILYGLPGSYYSDYVAHLLEVTPEAAARALRRHLDPQRLAVVVAGDARLVRPQLERLGPVRLLRLEDFLGPQVPLP